MSTIVDCSVAKDVLPLLVADYMPQAKVFLYDENLYSKELLGWSGRNPDSTFVVGGYQSTMDASFKVACLRRPHIITRGGRWIVYRNAALDLREGRTGVSDEGCADGLSGTRIMESFPA